MLLLMICLVYYKPAAYRICFYKNCIYHLIYCLSLELAHFLGHESSFLVMLETFKSFFKIESGVE